MNVINMMNFVRQCEPRDAQDDAKLYSVTKKRVELMNKFGINNTFLLQYDVLCDSKFVDLFLENASEKTEYGLWYEVVEPLTTACNMPYRSENGWKWDWHIVPGFSMGYKPKEREVLIDEAMRKFKEVFGYYPKTVGSWMIDTKTVNYLSQNYDLDALCFCRDQLSTDAYTFRGGYFNQGYYPSKNNMFTPAQTDECRVNIPTFRLLGPCPIHNYDSGKYLPASQKTRSTICTMESVGRGANPVFVDWMYKTHFENENLGFGYLQIGQENSFTQDTVGPAIEMQVEKALKLKDVEFLKMCDTGKKFKEKYPQKTPATAVCGTDSWHEEDLQGVYYDCENFSVNFFRYNNQIFIRSWYLFDERVEDKYNNRACETFDAVYENLPIIETATDKNKENIGLLIDDNATAFEVEKGDNNSLIFKWGNKKTTIDENNIVIENAGEVTLFKGFHTTVTEVAENKMEFEYKGIKYGIMIDGAKAQKVCDDIIITGDKIKISAFRQV